MTNTMEQHVDLVLIDDSISLTTAWESAAKLRGKHIKTFNIIDEFLTFIPRCAKTTPIYIDYDLNASITGVELAKQLHEQGFTLLYIATGHSPAKFNKKQCPWITAVVTKVAPF